MLDFVAGALILAFALVVRPGSRRTFPGVAWGVVALMAMGVLSMIDGVFPLSCAESLTDSCELNYDLVDLIHGAETFVSIAATVAAFGFLALGFRDDGDEHLRRLGTITAVAGSLWILCNVLMGAQYVLDDLDEAKGIFHRGSQVILGIWLISMAMGLGRLSRGARRPPGLAGSTVMAKQRSRYVCRDCGHESLAWAGQCPGCSEWNTLEEVVVTASSSAAAGRSKRKRGSGVARSMPLREVQSPREERLGTGIGELDRVLGGGLVPGSLVLLGGSPGIGKSTITAMALGNLAGAGRQVLYVTGEESTAQVRMRAERLGEGALDVPALAETDLAAVVEAIETERPDVCVVDSVQTLHSAELTSAPGSVAQVREAANGLMEVAKRNGTALVLVGHVTKEGAVAGPRVLEHLVDCVLLFEGERERSYRTLRALKNRFGATSELGVFEMRSAGLVEVEDPSARFVGEATAAAGSVVLCAMEGTRPLLVEVQALVAPTEVVPPRRVANGIDRNRLAMILAVLSRHGGVGIGGADVFVNVAGGVRVDEPGADLAIALAIASAHRGEPLSDSEGRPLACFGEVGLTGELRYVAHAERRVAEAQKFGLTPVLGPQIKDAPRGLEPASTLRAALAGARKRSAPRCPRSAKPPELAREGAELARVPSRRSASPWTCGGFRGWPTWQVPSGEVLPARTAYTVTLRRSRTAPPSAPSAWPPRPRGPSAARS